MAYPQESFSSVTLLPNTLIHARRAAVSSTTLHYQLHVLKETGRYDAFKLHWHPIYNDAPETPPVPKHLFWDSDIGKWIEGACYLLHSTAADQRDATIQAAVDELVAMIASAQQPDGYLNIHYTVVAPGQRFTNLRDMHELYNAGHLLEAALAHDDLVGRGQGKSALLDTMRRYVDLLCTLFGPQPHQLHGYPGHPELELALLRLYARTGQEKHLGLARYFLLERGNPTGAFGRHFYKVEAERRGEDQVLGGLRFAGAKDAWWYMQAHKPITEQEGIEGHSVRAMYLLTAAADLCLREEGAGEGKLVGAVRRLWDDMVGRKMYVTGGLGAIKQWEGFGLPYFLPQSKEEGGCYVETCAGIGVMMLAERLLAAQLDGSVGDIMELALYNAVLTGMSSDGKKFTYWNPLGSSDGALAQREEWFTCACCPPNVLRLLGQIGGYIYSQSQSTEERAVNVHLFVASTGTFKIGNATGTLTQESDYPWSGEIKFSVSQMADVGVNIRIPAWAKDKWSISPAAPDDCQVKSGYLRLSAGYIAANPSFTLSIPLAPRYISTHPYASHPHTALARGPIIYCVEDVDNAWVKDHFRSVQIDIAAAVEEQVCEDAETSDKYVALCVKEGSSLLDPEYIDREFAREPGVDFDRAVQLTKGGQVIEELKFVPYFFRANRKVSKGVSRVGLRPWRR